LVIGIGHQQQQCWLLASLLTSTSLTFNIFIGLLVNYLQITLFQQCWWCSDDISYQLHIWWAGPTDSAGVWSRLAMIQHHCSCPVFYTVSHHCLLGTLLIKK